ncbi:MAG: hypothetical protein K8F52_12165 [Candidatus Scalindua rubra]|nr:hypothetical protein [Candidatus Scalindua rubra]
MKSLIWALLLLTNILIAQTETEFKSEMITITTDQNIETEKLTIKLVEGFGWNITLYDLFLENKIVENNFPKEKGIYTLVINYLGNLVYRELVLYKTDPKNEHLEFDFYKENNRIFCRIKSDYATELNKEIVMSELDSEMKKILETINTDKN